MIPHTVKIELDIEQAKILREALELHARCQAGKFEAALEEIFSDSAHLSEARDFLRKLETCTPRKWRHDNEQAQLAFQCMMSLRRFLWEQQPEDQRLSFTVDSDRPMPYGEHNPPKVALNTKDQK